MLHVDVILRYIPVPVKAHTTTTYTRQSQLITLDFHDLVHWVFSGTVQNVPQRIVQMYSRCLCSESEGYVCLWEGRNLQWEAEVSKCDPLSRTMQL